MYNPEQIVEIVYHQRSLWERIKLKTKNFVKNIPSMCFEFVKKLVMWILTLLGFNSSISSMIFKGLSKNMIVEAVMLMGSMLLPGWLTMIFSLFKKFF